MNLAAERHTRSGADTGGVTSELSESFVSLPHNQPVKREVLIDLADLDRQTIVETLDNHKIKRN